MKTYKYTDSTKAVVFVIDEDGLCRLSCLSSALPEGIIIEAADPAIIPVPQRITNYQGKVTLDAYQLYEDVEAYMNLPDTPRAAKLAWATGAFERQGTMVLAMAAMLGLTDEQVDNMFIYGFGVV